MIHSPHLEPVQNRHLPGPLPPFGCLASDYPQHIVKILLRLIPHHRKSTVQLLGHVLRLQEASPPTASKRLNRILLIGIAATTSRLRVSQVVMTSGRFGGFRWSHRRGCRRS